MLPLSTNIKPMLAFPATVPPLGRDWQYEPKWDGFRALIFKDEKKLIIKSRNGKDLNRYFPELVFELGKIRAKKFIIDGEIVVPLGKGLSFDNLLQRIHPAQSRVQTLSKETPALFLVFDLLAEDSVKKFFLEPLDVRRKELEKFARKFLSKSNSIILSPCTRSYKDCQKWLKRSGNSLDGIIAKQLSQPYLFGERDAMQKIKFKKTADCVVGGFRYSSNAKTVGSLLLGLYDERGVLNHVGYTSSFTRAERGEWFEKLEKLIGGNSFTGKSPGGQSRWSTERSTKWISLKPKLVVEVEFDHFTGERFRHGTRFLRIRPDKAPRDCTTEQIGDRNEGNLLILTKKKRA